MSLQKEKNTALTNRVGWISILMNVALFVGKYWIGISTGSIALIADAWHTLTDSISSVAVIVGNKIAAKPADDKHPYGHGRVEHITAIFIGVLLAIIGFEFLVQSAQRLTGEEKAVFGAAAIWVTIGSIVVKEGMAQLSFWTARKTGSRLMKADGHHHRSDAFSSLLILIGIFLGRYFWWIDGVLGCIVALMIFYTAYEILSEEIDALIGLSPEEDMMKKIRVLAAQSTKREVFLHHFHIHQYGDHTEVSCHLKLPGEMSLAYAHRICSTIEKTVRKELNIELTIHAEPMGDKEWDML